MLLIGIYYVLILFLGKEAALSMLSIASHFIFHFLIMISFGVFVGYLPIPLVFIQFADYLAQCIANPVVDAVRSSGGSTTD